MSKKPTPASSLDKIMSKFRELCETLHPFKSLWPMLFFVCGLAVALGTFFWKTINSPLNANIQTLTYQATNTTYRLDQLDKRLEQLNAWVSDRYPSNGVIAEFCGSTQPDIITSCHEELSLFSDSAHGGSSLIWYERILNDPSKGLNSDGFLRIHYHLNPKGTPTPVPYVGVFAYFGNPPRMFDISRFGKIQIKARANQTNGSSCEYSFHLFDPVAANAHNYSWAGFKLVLPSGNGTNWPGNPCSEILEDLHALDPFPKIPFDLTHVFGFAIQIVAPDSKEAIGDLDIDDIRFRP